LVGYSSGRKAYIVLAVRNSNVNCPLCQNPAEVFYHFKERLYYQCVNCKGIFVDLTLLPNIEQERARYQEHNNDVNDLNYQQFVSPITKAIQRDFTSRHKGLDFGAGTGPVISKVLADNRFTIKKYDPLFHNNAKLLDGKYDYIACCEVIEHFHNPKNEFHRLKNLLQKKGKLYCMTDLYNSSVDFHLWYYKNDPTHVFIYQQKTLKWIQQEFGFSNIDFKGRLVTFSN